jgi:hypothetical protein
MHEIRELSAGCYSLMLKRKEEGSILGSIVGFWVDVTGKGC